MTKLIKYIAIAFLTLSAYSCNIAAGSYPYAEGYDIDAKEDDVINAIDSFKKTHSTYDPPVETQLTDGQRDSNDHWYHVYFYYPDKDQLIKTWIRPGDKYKTTFAFVAVNQGLVIGNWKRINRDFSDKENEEQKNLFEQRILKEVQKLVTATNSRAHQVQ